MWDGRTGKTHEVKPEKTDLVSVASSTDGRIVAAGDVVGGVHVWDLTDLLKGLPQKAAKLDAKELDEHWATLSEADGERAFQSVRASISAPGQTLPALRERLKPAKAEKTGCGRHRQAGDATRRRRFRDARRGVGRT